MSFQNQSSTMAQEQAKPQQQLTSEQLLPTPEHLIFGDSNHLFNPHQFKCDHPIIVEILKNQYFLLLTTHPLKFPKYIYNNSGTQFMLLKIQNP